ncbi:MAM and LDL-receptor class A domain-containing protein 1-like [Phlebotomus papatasi]|uniref:MAM and LDL-receptor class A domain-containing protein 1-like n=1 Tax=Phlebotomus papatasi TaxID=29031 RepID=UPI002484296D|nr:MAM and LDL-receptor class A domain-containing protein 1-like [Phlebotomus papatasi]
MLWQQWGAILAAWCYVAAAYTPAKGRYSSRATVRNFTGCETPYIRHGSIVRRQRGRTVEYICDPPYHLVGNRFSVCMGGRWDLPVPLCAKAGCSLPPSPPHGTIVPGEGMSSALLFCLPGYEVAGARETFCDGTSWDRSLGSCRETRIGPQTSCDFESTTLCGWTNDHDHDINWIRSSGTAWNPSMPSKSGPRHDHTIGKALEGHFMTVDNLRHIRHGGARLLSPIYNATYSRGCFRFYYNMYGAAVGTFTIYQKPLSVSMDGIKDFVVLFTISGNRGNLWNSGDVFLEIMTEPFQIVLEATMASTSADISIDDVELDVNCRSTYPTEWTESTESTSSPTVTDIGIYSVDSCVKRCSENATVATNGSFIKDHLDTGLTMKCDCHPDCLDLKSCCPDYLEMCLGDTDVPTSVTETYTDTLNHLQTYHFEHTVIVSSGIASILLILLISVLLLWHHRRKIHHSRKSVDVVFEKKKFNHEDGDDSDIKCLTSRMDDEELDFTLMTNDNVSYL